MDFVQRADLVLFVTSADRPVTETERLCLESIRNWGKKIVLVVNKIDIFENERDLAEVVQFVSESSMRLLGIVPEVFFGQRAAAVLPAPRERPAGLTAFQWLIYLTYCRRGEILAPDSLPNWWVRRLCSSGALGRCLNHLPKRVTSSQEQRRYPPIRTVC